MATEYQILQDGLNSLRLGLHALYAERRAAIERGDQVAAAYLSDAIQKTAREYNGYVARLKEIEGPSGSLVFLDRVGDVVIDGVKAGATAALELPNKVVQAAGRGLADLVLPVLVPVGLLIILLIFAAGKSGALKVKGVFA